MAALPLAHSRIPPATQATSPFSFHACPNLSPSFKILADEIPESAWRPHCVARHQGKQE